MNLTFLPALEARRALARAFLSISGDMSRPIERPVGPTLSAAWKTSKPAPDPRSKTVSPCEEEDVSHVGKDFICMVSLIADG